MGAEGPRTEGRGMLRSALPIALAAAALAAPSTASALDEQGYWAFADRMQTRIDRYWDDRGGWYPGMGSGAHADVLLTYAVAARRGHEGPARNDRRARRLVDLLVSSPPFVEKPPHSAPQAHAPGFVSTVDTTHGFQHVVVDAEVVDGLRHAWLARRELGLSDAQSEAIADRIHRTAIGRFWRWPAMRLNQINWYALVYAANATVTGSPRLLRHDLRLQIQRFVARARRRRRQLRTRAALQLPASLPAEGVDEHGLGGVREHHRVVHARVRAGPASGDAGPVPGRTATAAAVDDARPRRILDPRRPPELGHGLRLPPLAADEEARAQPAGAARHRERARPGAAPGCAGVGEVDARSRLRLLRAPALPQRRRAAGTVLRRPQAAAGRRQRAPRARAHDLERRAGDRGRPRLRAGQ